MARPNPRRRRYFVEEMLVDRRKRFGLELGKRDQDEPELLWIFNNEYLGHGSLTRDDLLRISFELDEDEVFDAYLSAHDIIPHTRIMQGLVQMNDAIIKEMADVACDE